MKSGLMLGVNPKAERQKEEIKVVGYKTFRGMVALFKKINKDCKKKGIKMNFTIEKMKYSEKSIREKISKEYELRLSDLQNELNKFHKIFKKIYIKIT